MFIPLWIIGVLAVVLVVVTAWLATFLRGRNPLPFPDQGSRIFTTPSIEAKAAVIALLRQHGLRERFQFNSATVQRSILWDGTIINTPDAAVLTKLNHAAASIGLVVADPAASATAAAAFLQGRGFSATVVLDAEPELPIAFVVTNVFTGTVLNFRKHVTQLPRPTPVSD
ncbi:MAG: hypothetical protein U0132_13335 [Gemmatimonadaceae bacterium]